MTRRASVVAALFALHGCARPAVVARVTPTLTPAPTPTSTPTPTPVEDPWPVEELPPAASTTRSTLGLPGPATPVWMSPNGRFVAVYRWNPGDVPYRVYGPLSVDLHDVATGTTTSIDEVIAFDPTKRWCLYRRDGHLVLLDGMDGSHLDTEREGVLTEDSGYLSRTRIVSFGLDGDRAYFPLRDGSGFVEYELAGRTARRTVVPGGVWYVQALALPQGCRVLQWPAGSSLPRGDQFPSSGYIASPVDWRDHPPFRREDPPTAEARLVMTPDGTVRLSGTVPASDDGFRSSPTILLDELELLHPGGAALGLRREFRQNPAEVAAFHEGALYVEASAGWRSRPSPPLVAPAFNARVVSVRGRRLLPISMMEPRPLDRHMGWIDVEEGAPVVVPMALGPNATVAWARADWLLGAAQGGLVMVRLGERRVRQVPSVSVRWTERDFLPYGRALADSVVPFPEHGGYVRAPGWLVDASSGGCALTATGDLDHNWYEGPFTVTCIRDATGASTPR